VNRLPGVWKVIFRISSIVGYTRLSGIAARVWPQISAAIGILQREGILGSISGNRRRNYINISLFTQA